MFGRFKLSLVIASIAAVVSVSSVAIAQVYPFVAGDVSGVLGNNPVFPFGLAAYQLNQGSAGQFAKRAPLVAGVVTFTFPAKQIAPNGQPQATAYNSIPVCFASEESSTGHYLKITTISTSAVTFTSDVTTGNTDNADIVCVGDPN